MTAALLAHQGGWDELLMVLAPIVIFGVLLVVANRRANSIESQRQRDDGDDGDDRSDTPSRRRDDPTAR